MAEKKLLALKKGDILFDEGSTPDCMYLIQKGRITITKLKGETKIPLAELKQGDILGEMAFFDLQPRSAGAEATINSTEVMVLPFSSLQNQFDALPSWIKGIMKSVNNHLRKANQKIRQLEKTAKEERAVFPPLTITKLSSILSFVATKYGEQSDDGLLVPFSKLRVYTIQVFQQATHKMQTFMENLQDLGYMTVEDIGEGRMRICIKDLDFLFAFTEFYNHHIFADKKNSPELTESETRSLKILIHYGSQVEPAKDGMTEVSINDVASNSMKEIGQKFTKSNVESMLQKNILADKILDDDKEIVRFDLAQAKELHPYWELISTLRSIEM